ncbi:MAG: hypothetical protein ACK5ME_08645 [Parahaliea sp.]
MTQIRKTLMATAVTTLFAASTGQVLADADIAVQPAGTATEATTHVDLRVIVPELLIFGVGPVGDTISQITWTVGNAAGATTGNNQTYSGAAGPFTLPAPFTTAATAAITNGGTGSSVAGATANLPVFLFSNNGSDVTITSTVAGGTGAGTPDALDASGTSTATIPIADFTVSETGNIVQPDIAGGSSQTADTAATSGIVNEGGTWTYSYTPSSLAPQAGEYTARVTYVAAQP